MHIFLRKARTSYSVTIPKDLVEVLDLKEQQPLKLALETRGKEFVLTLTPVKPEKPTSSVSLS